KDPNNFKQPIWPTAALLRIIHNYGRKFDPLLMARPIFFKITVWIDVLYFGPFYAIALYAFIKKKNWIRNWTLLWISMMLVNLAVIFAEELYGEYKSPNKPIIIVTYIAYVIFPLIALPRVLSHRRMWIPDKQDKQAYDGRKIFNEKKYSVLKDQNQEWNDSQIREELKKQWDQLSSSEKNKYSDKAEERNRNPEYQHKNESTKKRTKNN
ncbi:MAG: hypothetical protein EZS28_041022, partial [Streblomastix strix]